MYKNRDVRVRFGPSLDDNFALLYVSPVLINWIFAKKFNGNFVYRIDDTNTSAVIDGALEDFTIGMKWLGLEWDEGVQIGGEFGPYFQKERGLTYEEFAQKLIDSGDAYWCFCSQDDIGNVRKKQKEMRVPTKYIRTCRDLSEEEIYAASSKNKDPVLRFKTPLSGKVEFNDLNHGLQSINLTNIDDFIILKSDRTPTYHLAVVVDDYLMKISHIIRDASFLVNTPPQLLIYKALGFELPEYLHYPRINVPDDYEKVYIMELKKQGYCPESIINHLADISFKLPSAYKENNIILMEKLILNFEVDFISNSLLKKLNYGHLENINSVFIKKILSEKVLIEHIMNFLEEFNDEVFEEISHEEIMSFLNEKIPLIRKRMNRLDSITKFLLISKWDFDQDELSHFMSKLEINLSNAKYFLENFKEKLLVKEPLSINKSFLSELGTVINKDFDEVGKSLSRLLGNKNSNVSLSLILQLVGKDILIKRLNTLLEYVSKKEALESN